MKSVASHSSFLHLCQHFLYVTVKIQININITQYKPYPAYTHNLFPTKMTITGNGPCFPTGIARALNCRLNQCFGPFKKWTNFPQFGWEVIWPMPHTLFQGPFPITKPVDTQKHKQANKFSFRLRHHKKDLQLEKLPPLYDLASVGPYLLFFAP